MNPEEILGAPNRELTGDGQALTLGSGGEIVLEFDVFAFDGPGIDIYIFEVGEKVEATRVEVSDDLVNWVYVGDAAGALSGVDMNGKIPDNGRYAYVRLTDLHTVSTGRWPGADIDAVAVVNATLFK
jgi:hypothetical protein